MFPGRPSPPSLGRLRRGWLKVVAALLTVPLVIGACGGEEAAADPVELSIFWWGGEARARLTEEALALYTRKHPNVTFKKSWQANQGYFDKLGTLIEGNTAPDIFQIDDNYLTDYASRDVTVDLYNWVDQRDLDVEKVPLSLLRYGEINGRLIGMALGENTQGMVYNKTVVNKHNLPEPATGMSWEELITWAERASVVTGIPGTMDPSADYKAFWVWLRQREKDLYIGDDVGFSAADATKWFELWADARARRATPSAEVIREGNATDVTKQLVVTGKALTSWVWVNQLPELRKSSQNTELGVVGYPGDPSAQWGRAAMYLSVSKASKHKDAAVDVIDFLINDPQAGLILGTDRGLPPNLEVREEVEEKTTDPAMQLSIKVENYLGETFGESPSVPPKGHPGVRSELTKAAESVVLGNATPVQAGEAFHAVARAAIGK